MSNGPQTAAPSAEDLGMAGVGFSERTFEGVRWTKVDWTSHNILHCRFRDCTFERVNGEGLGDYGNQYINCRFDRCQFRRAGLGYEGTRFVGCHFQNVNFQRTSFIRPEFDDCSFVDCRLSHIDFHGSSFERCRFAGRLNEVWFRGGLRHESDAETFGPARPNRMLNVDFSEAILQFCTFSNQCDLSTVVPPRDPAHIVLDRWPERVERLRHDVAKWSPADQVVGERAYQVLYSGQQPWMLINKHDFESYWGDHVADLVWQSLVAPFES
jgi:fluoroquinolone resistance protein